MGKRPARAATTKRAVDGRPLPRDEAGDEHRRQEPPQVTGGGADEDAGARGAPGEHGRHEPETQIREYAERAHPGPQREAREQHERHLEGERHCPDGDGD